MIGAEDVAAARFPDFHQLLDLPPDVIHRALVQGALTPDAAAPEDDVLPKLTLQHGRVHALSRRLNGVQGVDARIDELRDQGDDRAAGMQQHLHVRVRLVDKLADPGNVGLEQLPEHLHGDHRRPLAPVVIADKDRHDVLAHRLQILGQEGLPLLRQN